MKKLLTGVVLVSILPIAAAEDLTIEQAVSQAINHDGWLISNKLKETAYRDEATSHSTLPDPTLSLGVANLPTDSWDFDQENMTQLKVGVTQRFPSGDILKVKSRKSQLMAEINPYQREERKAQLTRNIIHLWLDAYLAIQSIQLIESDRYLFEQLVDVTTVRYQSAFGKARQQDVVRAQLELTKLEDRLTRLHMRHDANRELLSEWLPSESQNLPLAKELSSTQPISIFSVEAIQIGIKKHPQLRITDKQIDIQQTNVDLARQEYKPGWALNASYGYREDAPTGMERSDFFSVGVSFDLPIFTENRQDKTVSAANLRKQAYSIDYELLEKKLTATAFKTLAELERLEQRSNLYQKTLLKQVHEQAEASLSAYTNDDGDFADVMRAYIAELNSKIEALEIDIKKRKALATMNYLMVGLINQAQGEQK